MRYHKYSRLGFDTVGQMAATAVATDALALGAYNISKKDESGCDSQFTQPFTLVTCPTSDINNMVFGGLRSLLEVSTKLPDQNV